MNSYIDNKTLFEKEFEETVNNDYINDFIKSLKINKLKSNLYELKLNVITSGKSLDEYQSGFSELEFNCDQYLNTQKDKQKHKQQDEHQNIGTDDTQEENSSLATATDKENSIETTSESPAIRNRSKDLESLKQKLFQRNTSLASGSSGEGNGHSNDMEEHVQKNLITEITQLTTTLKENAKEFDKQLTQSDKDILKKTETNLSKTSSQLSNLGTKLSKFSNSRLGVMFYLACVFFMIVSLLLTYMIIKIFPEM